VIFLITFVSDLSFSAQGAMNTVYSVHSCGKPQLISDQLRPPILANICHRLSVCLSSVKFVHPTQAIEIFGNVSTLFGTLAIPDLSIKILRRSSPVGG